MVAGQTAALALKKIKRSAVRKGMVLVDERLRPVASWEFDADIAILTHSTTIQPRYQVQGASDALALGLPLGFACELKVRQCKLCMFNGSNAESAIVSLCPSTAAATFAAVCNGKLLSSVCRQSSIARSCAKQHVW